MLLETFIIGVIASVIAGLLVVMITALSRYIHRRCKRANELRRIRRWRQQEHPDQPEHQQMGERRTGLDTGPGSGAATVRVAWVEPAEQLNVLEGEISEQAVREGEIVNDVANPGPAGVYRLLSMEECIALDAQNPLPFFLHDDSTANLITWLEPLQHAGDEATVAEHVRKAVFDLVEERVADAGVFSASPVVTSTELVRGSPHVVGRCVVIRPAA